MKKEKQQVKNRSIFQMIAFAFCLVFLAAPTKAAAQSSLARLLDSGQRHQQRSVARLRRSGHHGVVGQFARRRPGTTGNHSTIHTTKTGADGIGEAYKFPSGEANDDAFHTYGVVWSANKMAFFVDNPSSPFFTVTPSSLLREISRHSMPISSGS